MEEVEKPEPSSITQADIPLAITEVYSYHPYSAPPSDSTFLTIVYGLMGFSWNYQRNLMLVSNYDAENGLATITRRNRGKEIAVSIGVILLAENLFAVVEEYTERLFGESTMKSLLTCLLLNLGGYYFMGFGRSNALRLLGISVVSFSVSLSASALIRHLALFNKRLLMAYLLGSHFSDIMAPLLYTLTAEHLSFGKRLLPLVVLPVIQIVIFVILLKGREQARQEELSWQKVQALIFTNARSLPKFRDNWRLLSPYIILQVFEVYSSQGICKHLDVLQMHLSKTVEFRLYNTISKIGCFLGALIGHFVWTTQMWILSLVEMFGFAILLSRAASGIALWEAILLLVCEGLISGFGKMSTFFAIRRQGDDSPEEIALSLRVIQQASKFSGIVAGLGLTMSDDLLYQFESVKW
ncbi:uncharacterized protein LOC119649335 isoform X2 [Hermetia illucens]|uniref:uncharacterized protein LOC119649335 isoform X2 n=1 Tax=Hermetia illucens TaxID=343691 RepID=UPI0018CC012E|nr:uncharacterized protein LOC119649335 isoform X2 [Hermetia illucens]